MDAEFVIHNLCTIGLWMKVLLLHVSLSFSRPGQIPNIGRKVYDTILSLPSTSGTKCHDCSPFDILYFVVLYCTSYWKLFIISVPEAYEWRYCYYMSALVFRVRVEYGISAERYTTQLYRCLPCREQNATTAPRPTFYILWYCTAPLTESRTCSHIKVSGLQTWWYFSRSLSCFAFLSTRGMLYKISVSYKHGCCFSTLSTELTS